MADSPAGNADGNDTNSNGNTSSADTEKKSPLGKMLSRSSSLFSRSPKSANKGHQQQSSFDSSSGHHRGDSTNSNSSINGYGHSRGTRSHSPSAPGVVKRSGSAERGSIESIFAAPLLPRLRAECRALIDDDTATIQQLKAMLNTSLDSVDELKDKCIDVEMVYKASLQQAYEKYQATLNELFVMEQKTKTDDSIEAVQLKFKNLKERTVKIDKERRMFEAKVSEMDRLNQMQEVELRELKEVTGGSMEEIRMQAVDAKMTRTLFTELGHEKTKVENLERELNHDQNHFAEMSAVFDEKTQDFKARMEILEEQHLEMSRELTKAERESAMNHEEMNSYKTSLTRTNDRMRQLIETTVTKMEYDEELQRRQVSEMKAESETSLRKNLERQLEATHHKFVKHIEELKGEVETATSEYSTVKTQKEEFENLYQDIFVDHKRLLDELDVLSTKLDIMTEERKTSIAVYIDRISTLEQERDVAAAQHEGEVRGLNLTVTQLEFLTARQQKDVASLHSQIDELKGNIRVFARIRPLLPEENAMGQAAAAVVPLSGGYSLRLGRSGQNAAMLDPMLPDDPDNTRSFGYDKVFPPDISQSAVFEQVSEYVQATMEGHATCLMSYGQTGSGKTFSMQGPSVDPTNESRGIIPRAMEEIARQMTDGKAQGWNYSVSVSFVQIYMETIQDLLRDNIEDVKHEVKKAGNSVLVTDVNMMQLDPSDTSQITKIMNKAAKMRSVASTNQNAESSRSHAIFTLHIHGENEEAGQELDGTMYLVDLAGSERLSKSQASGDTLKETQFINKSLSALGDVFLAIANKSTHVPYRNSKLTYILQSALSGFHKTLMIVHLSPTEDSYGESLCTMRFASQVNSSSATSSMRSMSFSAAGGNEQGQGGSSPGLTVQQQQRTPSLGGRSPSLSTPQGSAQRPGSISAMSPRNSLTLGSRRMSGDFPTPPPSPKPPPASPKPPKTYTRSRSGSMTSPEGNKTPDRDGVSEKVTPSPTKVKGIAKVFTFDFDDEPDSGEQSPAAGPVSAVSSTVPALENGNSPGSANKPPISPKASPSCLFGSENEEQASPADDPKLKIKVTDRKPIPLRSPLGSMSRGASQGSLGRRSSSDIKSPGTPETRKRAVPRVPLTTSASGEIRKSRRPSYASANAVSPQSPPVSQSGSPSPSGKKRIGTTAAPRTPKSKSTF